MRGGLRRFRVLIHLLCIAWELSPVHERSCTTDAREHNLKMANYRFMERIVLYKVSDDIITQTKGATITQQGRVQKDFQLSQTSLFSYAA